MPADVDRSAIPPLGSSIYDAPWCSLFAVYNLVVYSRGKYDATLPRCGVHDAVGGAVGVFLMDNAKLVRMCF